MTQQYSLRWNNHQPNFISMFTTLLNTQTLVDVTLAAEGKHLQAHKVVLSACSTYFQALFVDNPSRHPIVILKDVTFADLRTMVDFMYYGEVNVTEEQLPQVLDTAKLLKIKGLTEMPDSTSLTRSQGNAPDFQSPGDSVESQRHSISPAASPRNRQKRRRKSSTGSTSLNMVGDENRNDDGGQQVDVVRGDSITLSSVPQQRRLREYDERAENAQQAGEPHNLNVEPLAMDNNPMVIPQECQGADNGTPPVAPSTSGLRGPAHSSDQSPYSAAPLVGTSSIATPSVESSSIIDLSVATSTSATQSVETSYLAEPLDLSVVTTSTATQSVATSSSTGPLAVCVSISEARVGDLSLANRLEGSLSHETRPANDLVTLIPRDVSHSIESTTVATTSHERTSMEATTSMETSFDTAELASSSDANISLNAQLNANLPYSAQSFVAPLERTSVIYTLAGSRSFTNVPVTVPQCLGRRSGVQTFAYPVHNVQTYITQFRDDPAVADPSLGRNPVENISFDNSSDGLPLPTASTAQAPPLINPSERTYSSATQSTQTTPPIVGSLLQNLPLTNTSEVTPQFDVRGTSGTNSSVAGPSFNSVTWSTPTNLPSESRLFLDSFVETRYSERRVETSSLNPVLPFTNPLIENISPEGPPEDTSSNRIPYVGTSSFTDSTHEDSSSNVLLLRIPSFAYSTVDVSTMTSPTNPSVANTTFVAPSFWYRPYSVPLVHAVPPASPLINTSSFADPQHLPPRIPSPAIITPPVSPYVPHSALTVPQVVTPQYSSSQGAHSHYTSSQGAHSHYTSSQGAHLHNANPSIEPPSLAAPYHTHSQYPNLQCEAQQHIPLQHPRPQYAPTQSEHLQHVRTQSAAAQHLISQYPPQQSAARQYAPLPSQHSRYGFSQSGRSQYVHSEVQYEAEQHTSLQYAPPQYEAQQHMPLQHAPRQYEALQHMPLQHAPRQYEAEQHTSLQYAPPQYEAQQHMPLQHAPRQYEAQQLIPLQYAPPQYEAQEHMRLQYSPPPYEAQQHVPRHYMPSQYEAQEQMPLQHAPRQYEAQQHMPLQFEPPQYEAQQHMPLQYEVQQHIPMQSAPPQYEVQQHMPLQHEPPQSIAPQHSAPQYVPLESAARQYAPPRYDHSQNEAQQHVPVHYVPPHHEPTQYASPEDRSRGEDPTYDTIAVETPTITTLRQYHQPYSTSLVYTSRHAPSTIEPPPSSAPQYLHSQNPTTQYESSQYAPLQHTPSQYESSEDQSEDEDPEAHVTMSGDNSIFMAPPIWQQPYSALHAPPPIQTPHIRPSLAVPPYAHSQYPNWQHEARQHIFQQDAPMQHDAPTQYLPPENQSGGEDPTHSTMSVVNPSIETPPLWHRPCSTPLVQTSPSAPPPNNLPLLVVPQNDVPPAYGSSRSPSAALPLRRRPCPTPSPNESETSLGDAPQYNVPPLHAPPPYVQWLIQQLLFRQLQFLPQHLVYMLFQQLAFMRQAFMSRYFTPPAYAHPRFALPFDMFPSNRVPLFAPPSFAGPSFAIPPFVNWTRMLPSLYMQQAYERWRHVNTMNQNASHAPAANISPPNSPPSHPPPLHPPPPHSRAP